MKLNPVKTVSFVPNPSVCSYKIGVWINMNCIKVFIWSQAKNSSFCILMQNGLNPQLWSQSYVIITYGSAYNESILILTLLITNCISKNYLLVQNVRNLNHCCAVTMFLTSIRYLNDYVLWLYVLYVLWLYGRLSNYLLLNLYKLF